MAKRKGGGGELSRSETVTVRLDPKLYYAAKLAARKHRRTLSSFIEWVMEEYLKNYKYSPDSEVDALTSAASVWDVDEADRFAKQVFGLPDLSTHDEEVLWKRICETPELWKKTNRDGTPEISLKNLNLKRLRKYWENK